MEQFSTFLLHLIKPVIMTVVLFVGVCISLIKFRCLGKSAFAAILGFLLLMFSVLFDIAHSVWIVFWNDMSTSRDWFETIYWTKTALQTLFGVLGFVLLMAAIFMKRPSSHTVG